MPWQGCDAVSKLALNKGWCVLACCLLDVADGRSVLSRLQERVHLVSQTDPSAKGPLVGESYRMLAPPAHSEEIEFHLSSVWSRPSFASGRARHLDLMNSALIQQWC